MLLEILLLVAPGAVAGYVPPPPSGTGVPASVVAVVQPGGVASGVPLTTQPVFHILDAFGALCTGSTLTGVITRTSGNATVSGGTAVAVGGVLTFTALALTGTGSSTFLLTVS